MWSGSVCGAAAVLPATSAFFLDGDDGAGDGIILRNCLLEKYLQGFLGAAAQIGKKLPVVEEVTSQDLRDAEDEMPGGIFLRTSMQSHSPNPTTRF